MRDLTSDVARHDDATSLQHQRDKAAKKIRVRMEYKAVPAIVLEAGSRIVNPEFKSPVKGLSFKMADGKAVLVDGVEYTKEAIKRSVELARYKRVRIREGKERVDYGSYKSGMVSLVTTVAPWAVATLQRLTPDARQELLLHLSEVQAEVVQRISGRPVFGGGIHCDTAVPHWHLHIPKTDLSGNVYPKRDFLTAGPWAVGACRIDRKFPNLLSGFKRDQLDASLERKNVDHLIDIHVALSVDTAMEDWIRGRNLWNKYSRDCEEYELRKRRVQKEEKYKRLMEVALERFVEDGVWPLAYRAMTLGMYKMIPRELRTAILMAIRAAQFVKQPLASVTRMVLRSIKLPSQPEIKFRKPQMEMGCR